MTAPAECRVLARYLSGAEPSEYVVRCYERGLERADSGGEPQHSRIDRILLGVARAGAGPARIADAYARVFRPRGTLRRRLILLLAILENSPPTAAKLNSAIAGRRGVVLAGLAGSLLLSAGCFCLGMVLFGPLHLAALRLGPR